ncbi:MAG: Na/Pi cotransporter family protein [Lutispora sp.]|nr:Na/Pi cotransporter family protein [Lutispora sp.]
MGYSMILGLFAGLAIFLYGMKIMSDALQKAAGDRMKKLLEVLTRNRLLAVLVGTAITTIIQSSSATTVMVVGLVNAGIMNLSQSVGVIMGANIGTTVTAQLIAFKFSNIIPYTLIAGTSLILFSKKKSNRQLGELLLGFGLLFFGMNSMSDAMKPLKEIPQFTQFMVDLQHNPILGVFAGFILTAVIQSSSATIGILQALAIQGLVPIEAALPILFGDNIGTCVTALLASIGANFTAKRAALMHLIFNIVGTIIFLIILRPIADLVKITSLDEVRQIANAHTFFNLANTFVQLPFAGFLVTIVTKIIPGEASEDPTKLKYLDKRILETPSIAVVQIVKEILRMAEIARSNVRKAVDAILNEDERLIEEVYSNEKAINELEKKITEYLLAVSSTAISSEQSKRVASLFSTVHDVERVGDHAENLVELAQFKIDNKIVFSSTAIEELKEIYGVVDHALEASLLALENEDKEKVKETDQYEERVDQLRDSFRDSHIRRLNNNECRINAGVIFLDIVTNLERISDHSVNIAGIVSPDSITRKPKN